MRFTLSPNSPPKGISCTSVGDTSSLPGEIEMIYVTVSGCSSYFSRLARVVLKRMRNSVRIDSAAKHLCLAKTEHTEKFKLRFHLTCIYIFEFFRRSARKSLCYRGPPFKTNSRMQFIVPVSRAKAVRITFPATFS